MKRTISQSQEPRTTQSRRGSIFPIFLISLILVAATAAVLVRTTLTQRSLVRTEELRLQADWLVHSAAARAAAKLASDPAYAGETWPVLAEELGQQHGASVEIAVSTIDANPTRRDLSPKSNRQVDITVNYPPEGNPRVRLSRQVFVKVSGE
ncbi:MAG: hypothetical protein O2820_10305 [Planctomycetota bacterium]|nr:hypothetical protein [Planctomycetota bacterium]MDA1249604.1 hypothetical protein [Planctomycetota bacterium]